MKKQIDVPAKLECFSEARQFVEEALKEEHVSSSVINENILVVEELFVRIIENCEVDDGKINVVVNEKFGEIKVFIRFLGNRFDVDFNNGDIYDAGTIILKKYEDKISLKYKRRDNTIRVVVRRKFDKIGRWSMEGIALAIIAFFVLNLFLTKDQQYELNSSLVQPLERMFATAIMLIATPVTFFSIVTNITNVAVVVDSRLQISRLIKKIAVISTATILIAVAYFFAMQPIMNKVFGDEYAYLKEGLHLGEIRDIFFNIIPNDIFQPFTELLPFQLVLMGVITSVGVISCNKHFDEIKRIIDAIYELFCRMLGIIMLFMPLAAFLSFFDMLLYDGAFELVRCLVFVVTIALGIAIIVAIRLLIMKAQGVPAMKVFKKCWPAIIENLIINSPIDAVPYNARFCNKEFGIKMEKLDMELPIYAEVSMGGNCFIISLVSMMLYQYAGMDLSFVDILVIVILVLGLSLGAPNQAGSVLIGLMIMIKFVNIEAAFLCTVIYCEVFFSRIVSALNAMSDVSAQIVDAYADEKTIKKAERKNESR